MTSSSTAKRFQRSAHRLLSHFADDNEVTLRRRSTLTNRLTGKAPSLLVKGLTAQDSGLITLDATNLSGTLATGSTFTITGDGQTYSVLADVEASSSELTDVPIDPPLSQAAANDAAVTLTSKYADVTVGAAVTTFSDELIDDTRIQATDRLVLLDLFELGIEVDMTTQVVVGSKVYQIKNILGVEPGLESFAMRLHVGVS